MGWNCHQGRCDEVMLCQMPGNLDPVPAPSRKSWWQRVKEFLLGKEGYA
jgi:hypothetical protein